MITLLSEMCRLKEKRSSSLERKVQPVVRLTQFEGKGHEKFPKGPPLLTFFGKISKGSPLCLRFLEEFPKGPLFAYAFWKNFQRIPPLLTFFGKFQKGPPFAYVF